MKETATAPYRRNVVRNIMKLQRINIGDYKLESKSNRLNSIYADRLIFYLNSLDPLFSKAKEVNEFEFVFTLLNDPGHLSDPGYDTFENTIQIFDSVLEHKNKFRNPDSRLNLFAWLYGHLVEASLPYNMIANLLNVINNQRYKPENFPDKVMRNGNSRPLYPHEKIAQLTTQANNIGHQNCLDPINDLYDNKLRNSIFHSDYSIYNQELRAYKDFSREETYTVFNKALAYYDTLKILYENAIKSYLTPKIIDVPAYFSSDSKAITMARKGKGLIGIKDYGTSYDYKNGKQPWMIAKMKGYERRIYSSDKSTALFPFDKIERLNKILKYTPKIIRKMLKKQIVNYASKLT